MGQAKRTFENEALERLARIEERLGDLPARVSDLEKHRTRAEGFMSGAKWVAVMFIGAVTAGFIKLGLGDALVGAANAASDIQHHR